MEKIEDRILKELHLAAKEEIKAIKGINLKDEDVLIAENLVVLGFLKGLEAQAKNESDPYARRSNLAIISSEWVHNN